MVERIEDLNLPNAVVARLIKNALPDGINVSKEARIAIGKAASVFIIYLSSAAILEAKRQKHKILLPQNIMDALEEIEMEHFAEPLKKSLEAYREMAKNRKDTKKKSNATTEADKDEVISIRSDDVISLQSDEVISVRDDVSNKEDVEELSS